jgi:transposase
MARFDLTDFEWSVIEPLLPTDVRGVERADDRRVLNGIFWRLRTELHGRISHRAMVCRRPAAIVSAGGVKRECGIAFSMPYQKLMMAIFR